MSKGSEKQFAGQQPGFTSSIGAVSRKRKGMRGRRSFGAFDSMMLVMDAVFRGERNGYRVRKGLMHRFGANLPSIQHRQLSRCLNALVKRGWLTKEVTPPQPGVRGMHYGRSDYTPTRFGRDEYAAALWVYDKLVEPPLFAYERLTPDGSSVAGEGVGEDGGGG